MWKAERKEKRFKQIQQTMPEPERREKRFKQ